MSVIKYEPVHLVRSAKRASNPKGLKNVARIKANVFSLFKFIVSSTARFVHNGIFFHVLDPNWKNSRNSSYSIYILEKFLETKG